MPNWNDRAALPSQTSSSMTILVMCQASTLLIAIYWRRGMFVNHLAFYTKNHNWLWSLSLLGWPYERVRDRIHSNTRESRRFYPATFITSSIKSVGRDHSHSHIQERHGPLTTISSLICLEGNWTSMIDYDYIQQLRFPRLRPSYLPSIPTLLGDWRGSSYPALSENHFSASLWLLRDRMATMEGNGRSALPVVHDIRIYTDKCDMPAPRLSH